MAVREKLRLGIKDLAVDEKKKKSQLCAHTKSSFYTFQFESRGEALNSIRSGNERINFTFFVSVCIGLNVNNLEN